MEHRIIMSKDEIIFLLNEMRTKLSFGFKKQSLYEEFIIIQENHNIKKIVSINFTGDEGNILFDDT